MNKKAKGRIGPKLYVLALHNIFLSMKGLRIFERFGLNLPTQNRNPIWSRLVDNCSEWNFDIARFNWFNPQCQPLTDYYPCPDLLRILQDQLETTSH